MPSEAFMKRVLETGSNTPREEEPAAEEVLVIGDEPEEEEEPQGSEAAEEAAPAEGEEEPEGVVEEPEEPEGEEPGEEEGEAEVETEVAHEDAQVYDGVWNDYFNSTEEVFAALQEAQEAVSTATKRERDARAWGNQRSRERAEMERELADTREALAYASGRVEASETQGSGDDFQEWAESALEENAPGGFEALRQQAFDTGDFAWVYKYVDLWGEEDPYRAANAKNLLDMQVATARLEAQRNGGQGAQPQRGTNPVGQVVADTLGVLREQHPDLADGNPVLGGTIQKISENAELHAALASGDPVRVTWAITQGRAEYVGSQGRTRRLSKGAQRELGAAKARATVASGTRQVRAPVEERVVPKEFEGSFDNFEKWGMVRK